ncbi:MAG: M4 family metallopeptidase [Nitrospirota bacterium]
MKPRNVLILVPLFLFIVSGVAFSGQPVDTSLTAAVEDLRQAGSGGISVEYNNLTGRVRFIGTDPANPIKVVGEREGDVSPEKAARHFIASYRQLFGLTDPSRELTLTKTTKNARGHSFTRFQQKYDGIPVLGGEMILQEDKAGSIVSVNARTVPYIAVDTTPRIDAFTAKNIAVRAVSKWHGSAVETLVLEDLGLWIYNPVIFNMESERDHLVRRIEVESKSPEPFRHLVLVDAKNGKIPLHFNMTESALRREIYDNYNDPAYAELPGYGPVRVEGQGPTGIADVDEAYDYMGDFYGFFFDHFNRDGIDGKGMTMVATVRYCETYSDCPYNNDFWSGSKKQIVLGYGTVTDDTVAHELAHGVTDFTADFLYYMQSGALSESMSDIWGEFVDMTNGRGNDSAYVRWLLFEDDKNGASRSMSNPHMFDQPDRMTDSVYYCGVGDNGGVHTNSGVGNKAAYLMADGGYFNGYSVTGLGVWKASRIYYDAQQHLLVSGSDYLDLYSVLYQACLNLVGTDGIGPSDCEQVRLATMATEMHISGTYCVYPKAPVCDSGVPTDLFFDDMEGNVRWTLSPVSQATVPEYLYAGYYATSGVYSLYGENLDVLSDFALAMKNAVTIPAGRQVYLHFNHAYDFESEGSTMYDGGIVEYSADGGAMWYDAGWMFINNGYDGTIYTGAGNPLSGRNAFTGTSFGYTASRLNISGLAGQNVKFRFRIGNDESYASDGWYMDDVRAYYCTPNGIDFTGEWTTLTQNCKNTASGMKCKIKGGMNIRNMGNQNAPSARVFLFLSDNNVYEPGDFYLKEFATGKIKKDKSKSKPVSYGLPLGSTASGKYVIAVIDGDNAVAEADENNNYIVYGPMP